MNMLRKYSIHDFDISFTDEGYFAIQKGRADPTWPFKVKRKSLAEYYTETEVIEGCKYGLFPFCKNLEAAKMVLIIAIIMHNEYIDSIII